MQMAKIPAPLARLRSSEAPYIAVTQDQTNGGVTASFAMLGDQPRGPTLTDSGAPLSSRRSAEAARRISDERVLLDKGMIDVSAIVAR